ncbi:hypothetical protein Leryth_005717 [Lithospermum erythrorhizon]|nr:hypothetical protein Leryth_005717 [Lithospermum erythrorhizon]
MELTDYERRRLENIKRNREMVAALNIHSTSTQLSSLTKRPRSQNKVKKENESPTVRRESMRKLGLPPDDSTAAGLKTRKDYRLKPRKVPLRFAEEPIAMSEAYRGEFADCKLINVINSISEKTGSVQINGSSHDWPNNGVNNEDLGGQVGSVQSNGASHDCPNNGVNNEDLGGQVAERWAMGSVDLGKLKLEPQNIERVVYGKIMSLKFFPTAERTLVVTGNTSGSVSFWDVSAEREDGPGIYRFHPHTSAVSGMVIEPFSLGKMLTSSYDGFIRLMDVERTMFDVVCSTNRPIYCISGQPNQLNSLYFGGDRGECSMCDLREPKGVTSWNLHGARINTIDFNTVNSNLMATSSPDGTACIWDVRKINANKPVSIKFVRHEKAVHSAFFSPTGTYIATTSDNRIKVGVSDGPNFQDFLAIQHSNKVSQGMAFRGTWGWDDSYLYIGNMEGGLDVISMFEGKTVATFKNRYVSAMPWRFAAHPCHVGMLAGATGGGEVYIWTS